MAENLLLKKAQYPGPRDNTSHGLHYLSLISAANSPRLLFYLMNRKEILKDTLGVLQK